MNYSKSPGNYIEFYYVKSFFAGVLLDFFVPEADLDFFKVVGSSLLRLLDWFEEISVDWLSSFSSFTVILSLVVDCYSNKAAFFLEIFFLAGVVAPLSCSF